MKTFCRPALVLVAALSVPACGARSMAAPAPPGFTLGSPGNAAIGVDGTPTFSWTPFMGATSYTVQVSTDPAFSTFVVDQSGLTATSFTPPAALAPGAVFFWQVLAQGPTGGVLSNGAPFTFTTVAPTPGDFTLTAPANGATGVVSAQTFRWTSSLGTASYRLQVATDVAFVNRVIDLPGLVSTSVTPSAVLASSTLYFWRVLAVSSITVTATNAPFAFTTAGTSAPGSFTLLNPASGAGGVPVMPTFTWSPSSGAETFRLEVAIDPAFMTTVIDVSGLTTTSVMVTTSLIPFTTYYWRVTATNAGGSTVASPAPLVFTTA